MTVNPLFLIYILFVLVAILLALTIGLELRLRKILGGRDAKTLEDSIVNNGKDIDKLKQFENNSILYFEDLEKRIKRSIQSVEVVRFNPFKGSGDGGDQSFSTSLIDEKGDGVILSSLYSRDRISVFAKPINKFVSQYELTEEEKIVLDKSKNKFH
jgi:hypothetical protein